MSNFDYPPQSKCDNCKDVTYDYFYELPNGDVIAVCKYCLRNFLNNEKSKCQEEVK